MSFNLEPIGKLPSYNPMLTATQIANSLNMMRARKQQIALRQKALIQQQQAAQFAHQQALQRAPLIQAQTQMMQNKVNNPQLGMGGLAGQWGILDRYRKIYGVNSPQYTELKNALDQQTANQTSLSNARGYRGLGPTAKAQGISELQNKGLTVNEALSLSQAQRAHISGQVNNSGIMSGGQPVQQPSQPLLGQTSTGQPSQNITFQPGNPQLGHQEAVETQSAIMKRIIPANAQKRIYMANSAQTAMRDMVKLGVAPFKYSGLIGRTKLAIDKGIQSESPDYISYVKDNQLLKAAQQDMANAMGVAMTDPSMKRFLPAFDIWSWANTPKVAQEAFNNASSFLHEMQQQSSMSIQQAIEEGKKPAPQFNIPGSSSVQTGISSVAASPSQNTVKMRSPAGQVHDVPKEDVKDAIAAGGQVVG